MGFRSWFSQKKYIYVTGIECSGGIDSTSKPTELVTCVTVETLLAANSVTSHIYNESTYNNPPPPFVHITIKK